MAPATSIIVTVAVIAILVLTITITALTHLCARHRNTANCVQRNTEDALRLTLSGPRSAEQVEYMKHVRARNLATACEEARRLAQRAKERGSRAIGHEGSLIDANSTYIGDDDDDDDDEADLRSVKSGAMVLGCGRAPAHQVGQSYSCPRDFVAGADGGEVRLLLTMERQYLAPPALPWLKHSPTHGSSIYSGDSAKSRAGSVVEEWESEHGGFSGYLGMKQPVGVAREERWA